VTAVEYTIEGPAGPRPDRLLLLSGREAHRLARHPALWLPLAIAVAGVGYEAATGNYFSAGSWYAFVFVTIAMLGPIVGIFAANMVTSGARRVRADEMLRATPMADTERTLAVCLGAVLTLGGIGTAGVVALSFIAATGSMTAEEVLTAGELAQIPPILAGGGLLGVLTARWLRFPGAALVTFVVFAIGGVIAFSRLDSETATWWSWWSSVPVRGTDEPFTYESPASAAGPWWHAVYLVGLCAIVTVAAVYRDRGHWSRLAAVGLPIAAVTALFGWLQLP